MAAHPTRPTGNRRRPTDTRGYDWNRNRVHAWWMTPSKPHRKEAAIATAAPRRTYELGAGGPMSEEDAGLFATAGREDCDP